MTKARKSLKELEHERQASSDETATAVDELLELESEKETTVTYKQKRDPNKKWYTGYIHKDTWDQFTRINEAKGVKSNQVLTMMIMDYIRDNQIFLQKNE